VEKAFSADKSRERRLKVASWCLGVLMVLMSISLTTGWSAVMQPVAWLGFRGLLNILMKGMALCTVLDKLQAILADILSLLGDIAVKFVLGEGGPAFWGCLTMLILAGLMFARTGSRMPGVIIKRR
jgi:hypothetical protein